MRIIGFEQVVEAAAALCGKAACYLPEDVKQRLLAAGKEETREPGKDFFRQFKLQCFCHK